MKNKFIKLVSAFLVATFLITPLNVFAATYPGDSFKVTLACGNIEGSVKFTATNATITGGTGNWCDRGGSFTVTAKASAAGNAVIKLIGVDATSVNPDANGNYADYSGKTIASKTVVVSSKNSGTTTTPSTSKSKDNNLKSLTISEGKLSPSFSASTTSYTVELESTVTSLKVNAVANHSKAKVQGTGTIELEPGENKIEITVTAENGNPKVYTINAIVDDSPIDFINFNGTDLGVVRNLKNLKPLDGFEETTITVNEKNFLAWHSESKNITVIYLQNESVRDYYIFNEGIVSIYKPLEFGKGLAYVDVPTDLQEREGMTFKEVTIDGMILNGWVFNDEKLSNYSLIYVMNEFGEYKYYQYESTGNTLQLYPDTTFITQEEFDVIVKENEEIKEKHEDMTIYFYIACGVAVIATIIAISGFVNANRYKKRLLTRNKFE